MFDCLQSHGLSQPGSFVHGILQARILEWVAISFSRGVFPIQGLNPGLLHCRRMDFLPSEPPTASEHKTFLEFNFKGFQVFWLDSLHLLLWIPFPLFSILLHIPGGLPVETLQWASVTSGWVQPWQEVGGREAGVLTSPAVFLQTTVLQIVMEQLSAYFRLGPTCHQFPKIKKKQSLFVVSFNVSVVNSYGE